MKTQSILCLTAVLFATLTNGQLYRLSSSKRNDEGANKKLLAKNRSSLSGSTFRNLQKVKATMFCRKDSGNEAKRGWETAANSNTTRLELLFTAFFC